MEPFLRVVRANPNIKGMTVGTMEHKLSAYVFDVLFHLTVPLVSLPKLMKELQLFGLVSNSILTTQNLRCCLLPYLPPWLPIYNRLSHLPGQNILEIFEHQT